jgi:two-component system response regulator VicR
MSKQNKYVIIAEDAKFIADIMANIIKEHGIRVTITHNGQEALEAMEKELPDVLLLDLLMPVLGGLGVMKAMKERHLDCPVIVVSNISDKKTRDICKDMDVKEYFIKSDMDDDDLWVVIEKYLR